MEEMPLSSDTDSQIECTDSEFSSSVDPCYECRNTEENAICFNCHGGNMNYKARSCSANSDNKSQDNDVVRYDCDKKYLADPASLDVTSELTSNKNSDDCNSSYSSSRLVSGSSLSMNHLECKHTEANSEVLSSSSTKRHHSIDVVITHCDEESSENLLTNEAEGGIPNKIVQCLSSLNASTSAPLLQPDRRGRYRHRSGGWIPDRSNTGLEDPFCPRPRLRLSRDHIQPSEGSLSELHGSPKCDMSQEEEEEDDELQPLPRPRSSTCPEIKAFKRKIRVRMMNRPPTPPPGDCLARRFSGRDAGSHEGSQEKLGSSEDMGKDGRMGVRFSLDSQDESVPLFLDEWGLRRQSEGCVLDLPIIEETA